MEDNRLEIQLTKIQSFVDHCVMQTFNILIGNIMRKKECIGLILLKERLQNEFLQITDNLSSIYMKYPALSCVEESYKENNFLWDSTFYDSLNKEQRGKYSSFDLATFDYSKYVENHTFYDEELPMFSSLVDAILYERYANYLKCEIGKIVGKTKDTPLTRTDLSTATDQINMKQPKGWEIIDKYIKQLKKD